MIQLPFPIWQILEAALALGCIVVLIGIFAMISAKLWGPHATQTLDLGYGSIGEALLARHNWTFLGVVFLIVVLLFLGYEAASRSANALTHLWPTATPTPSPRWDMYFPIMK